MRQPKISELNPIEKLNELLDKLDICRFIRISWLLSPMVNAKNAKARIFNFDLPQVRKIIDGLEDPVKKAKCLYLADDLSSAIDICQQCR